MQQRNARHLPDDGVGAAREILRYGQTLGFFDQKAVGSSSFLRGPRRHDEREGPTGVLSDVDGLLKERRPGIVVIDSFKALHPYAENQGDFRRFLHDLAARLSVLPVTSFWVGEYGRDDATPGRRVRRGRRHRVPPYRTDGRARPAGVPGPEATGERLHERPACLSPVQRRLRGFSPTS